MSKLIHYFKTILWCLIAFTSTASYGSNICKDISSNMKMQEYFSNNLSKNYQVEFKGKELHFTSPGSNYQGTCPSGSLGLSINHGIKREIPLICNYNGCALGESFDIVNYQDNNYAIGRAHDELFIGLKGWFDLSSEEQRLLQFRNTVAEIYSLSLYGFAEKICTSSRERPYIEKSLVESATCEKLASTKKLQSIFPLERKQATRLPVKNFHFSGVYYEPSQIIAVDINGDGTIEKLTRASYATGSGCGCYIEYIIFIDENNQPIVSNDDKIKPLFSSSCRASIDILHLEGQYFIEHIIGGGT